MSQKIEDLIERARRVEASDLYLSRSETEQVVSHLYEKVRILEERIATMQRNFRQQRLEVVEIIPQKQEVEEDDE